MGEKLKKVKLLKFMLVLGLAILSLAILMIFLGTNAQADIIVPVDQPTIQDAIDAAIPGENIYVWNGTYNENITIDKSVHLIGNGSATTIIDGFGTLNNIINITTEGVEITGFNITESGMWYGIWANVGGFSIHDNVFNTQNWAIYMDINRLNSGSTTIGDIIVDNNEVTGTHGFHFNIEIEEPLSGSDLILGKTEITNNTLYNTQKGIGMDVYTVFSMNQGSVTWGDIIVKNNYVNCWNFINSIGIEFYGTFWNITDVNIDLGKMEFSDNNVTAQTHGIYMDWWDFCDGIYGNTIVTTQGTYVHNNDIVSQSRNGIYLQTDAIGDIIYDSTSITTGDFLIFSNNITTAGISSNGIYLYMVNDARYIYNDSSVNFGDIYIDSNFIDSNDYGIRFNYRNSFGTDAYDNALVNMGDVQVTNNEILSVNHGVSISFDTVGNTMYDYASATLGNFIINDNNISSDANGIFIEMSQVGYDMHDRASLTMGYLLIDSNNITSVDQGINIQGQNITRNIYNDTMFSMGDFTVNSNTINSTNSIGIVFGISSSAYTMTGNATATFGSFLFTNNNITALTSHGLWCTWDYIGIDMQDGAVVTTKDFHLDDNTFECGILSYVIDWEFDNIGNDMHGDSFFSLGDRYAEGNIILSGFWGIYAGREFWGNDMYDNSIFMYGDFFIRSNVISVTVGAGIIIDYIDTGENMAGTSSVTGGNMSIINNIVASRDSEGIYIDYGYIGYNISDFSYVSTGWIDISHNNFSSVNNHGAYIWMDYNGAYMYGNSQVYIGDIMFTHNNVWSDTMDALNFNRFYRNAYMMYNDSYFQIGDILVSDNYFNASGTGDGIELFQWQQNAYEMYHNATAAFGNFLFTNNNITSASDGINLLVDQTAYNMYNDTKFSMGNIYMNTNLIDSAGRGISLIVQNSAYNMYGASSVMFGDFKLVGNNITSVGLSVEFQWDTVGYNMRDNSHVSLGEARVDWNILSRTGVGVAVDAYPVDVGTQMYGNSFLTYGDWYVDNNDIVSAGGGIYTGPEYCGYEMHNNAEVVFNNYYVRNNNIDAAGGIGLEVEYYDCGESMWDNSRVTGGIFLVSGNNVSSTNTGYYLFYDYIGYNMYDNTNASIGRLETSNNNFSSVSSYGGYIEIHYLGASMEGNSQAYIGDIMFTHNNFWSDTMDALYFYDFQQNAYQMFDDSYVQVGNILVNDNYLDAGGTGDGIELYLWQQNAYEMYHNASADFGDFEFNRNTIEAEAKGIYANNIEYWACYLYWNNHVTMGHWQFNDNKINTKDGTGIAIYKWVDIGTYMYGTSTLTVGNLEVLRNVINAVGGVGGMDVSIEDLAFYNYGSSQCYFGDFLFNNNIVNASGEGIYISAIRDSASYMYNNSYAHFGNIEVNNNDIIAGYGSSIGYDGIYFYFYDNGYDMHDNSGAYFGHLQINNNTITCHDDDGIYLELFSDIGAFMYDNSYFEIGNLEVCGNWIDANDVGMNIPALRWLAYTNYHNSTAVFGDFLFDANTIYAVADGIYINAYYWANTITGTSMATFGDLSVSNNIIESGYQGIYCQFEYAGYNMHDMTRFEMGSIKILNNTIISGQDPTSLDSYGIFFQTQYVGYEMHNETQAIVGPILFNDNTVTVLFGSAASGIYIGWMSDYATYMYSMASFTMNGNIEICRNIINTTNGANGILFDLWNFGSYLWGDNTASFGNILFNDNTIIDAYDTGIYVSLDNIGYITYGNSSVTIGNIELNNNDDIQIVNGSYISGICFQLYDMGSNMFDGSIFNMGHVQMNDNNIYNSSGYGLEIDAYRLGLEMHDSSSAYFGNFEVLRNNITSIDDGIFLYGFQNFAAYMYNNASAFFRDFLVNNNIISTTGSGGDGIYIDGFRFLGYQMNGLSYAEFGTFEVCDNKVHAQPLAYGIYIWPESWASNMYDNATFVMGDWLINNNTVFSSEYEGIYFYSTSFGYNMYGNSSAHFGKNEIMFNTVNSSGGDGIESWWWYDFGSRMYDYSYFEAGGCYIMFNNITSTSSMHYGLETGPQDTGYYVRDEAEAHFGDYIISNNTIYSNGTQGIYLWYYEIGYWLDNSNLPESRAIVEVGRVMVTDNIIMVPNGEGIYVDGYYVAFSENDYSSVITGGLYINRNTINSFGHGIDIYMEELGESTSNNAQLWFGSFVIDENDITSTNGNGIYIYSIYFAYSTYDNAFVSMDDIFITNNDIVAGITGIEFTCDWWIELYTSSSARAPGLWIIGNNVSAPVSAFNYTILNTPTHIDPGTTFSSGNVTISDNIFDGGLFGVMINWRDMLPSGEGQPDFYFENNSIKNGAVNSIGLYMINIQNSTIESLYLDGYEQGICVSNSNVWFMFNSTISNIPSYDLNLSATSFIGAVNTTFDNASVYFEDYDSLLNVGWFMNVFVQSQVFLPVPEANLTVKDVDGTDVFNGTTNLNGRAFYIICWEYQENITGIIKNFNDYTADANKAGSFGSAVPNPTMNQTRWINITLIDLIPPTIFSDNSDTAGTTGDPFYFEINATDNMGIVSVRVNYRFGGMGSYKNLTMNGTGPYWLNEIMPSDYVGFIEYYFTAVDSGGFWVNTTPTTAPITDNDPPTYTWVSQPSAGTTGESVLVSILATDNIDLTYYKIDIDGVLYDLIKDGDYYNYTINIPSDSAAPITYSIILNDSANNPNIITPPMITVTDNDQPTFSWISQPTSGTTGESVLVSILATDNIGITYYKIDIDGTLYDLIKDGDYYNYTINIPSDSAAAITYSLILNDSAGNPNTISPPMITVTDNDQPTFSWISQPTSGTTGESVLISILATDNIGITYYKIDIDGTLYDLIKDGDYYNYTINIPSDSAADISYSIILNDSANNPNIISPPMITVTDNDQPTYSWVSQPFSGTTGESVLVSILATDNIDITYYKIEIDGTLYDLTKDGDYYNYTINIPLDSTASITYRLIINDSDNNPNIIPDTVIVVTDNDAPTYNWVSKPTGGVVGSSVLVSLTAYDNIGIINYTIYIDGVPFDMVKDGDYYNYTIDIPPGIPVDIIYNVTFRDAAGHLVETGDTVIGVISVDVDAPEYSWILHPATGTTGESVLISLLATDNIGITYYKIEIDGVLYDLIKNGDYYNYTITIPTDSLASITYNIVFNDSANNPNSTAPTVLTVTDNDAPTYTWVLHPSTGTAGDSVLISLRAFDNIGVAYYKIEIDGTLYDLAREGGYFNYTINLPPGSSASVTYDIIFKDDADNQIATGDTVITVTIPVDNVPPEFNWVLHPDAGTTGDSLLVSLLATDNIGITYYKISIDGTLYDLVKDGDYYNYTINIPMDSLASITYFVVFNDSANNPNTAVDTVITVTDNDPSTISNPASDTSGQKGKEFRFQIDALDNIGISEVKVWYWFGDDDSQKTSLTLQESNGTYSGSFIPDESGTLHYYFEVTDEAGNTFESSENTVDIASEPEEEEANILPWIILVMVIVIVLLLFFLTKMRKKEPEELPAELEEGVEEEDVEVEPEEDIEEDELELGGDGKAESEEELEDEQIDEELEEKEEELEKEFEVEEEKTE